jgi:hypothetical protein
MPTIGRRAFLWSLSAFSTRRRTRISQDSEMSVKHGKQKTCDARVYSWSISGTKTRYTFRQGTCLFKIRSGPEMAGV